MDCSEHAAEKKKSQPQDHTPDMDRMIDELNAFEDKVLFLSMQCMDDGGVLLVQKGEQIFPPTTPHRYTSRSRRISRCGSLRYRM